MLKEFLSHFMREKLMLDSNLGEVRKFPQWWFIWWHFYWQQDGYEHYSPISYPVTDEERLKSINKTKYLIDEFKKLRIDNENIKAN